MKRHRDFRERADAEPPSANILSASNASSSTASIQAGADLTTAAALLHVMENAAENRIAEIRRIDEEAAGGSVERATWSFKFSAKKHSAVAGNFIDNGPTAVAVSSNGGACVDDGTSTNAPSLSAFVEDGEGILRPSPPELIPILSCQRTDMNKASSRLLMSPTSTLSALLSMEEGSPLSSRRASCSQDELENMGRKAEGVISISENSPPKAAEVKSSSRIYCRSTLKHPSPVKKVKNYRMEPYAPTPLGPFHPCAMIDPETPQGSRISMGDIGMCPNAPLKGPSSRRPMRVTSNLRRLLRPLNFEEEEAIPSQLIA